ncbi:MAG: ribosome-binding factor A [Omnitrophica bacterium RIFCSPLOWO2_01_FULL_45_10b]|nr:MAG: ribosome-binding factor A [Omnitrophica bacterium RIFCSPLOWO2_01_FULL_45_10b]
MQGKRAERVAALIKHELGSMLAQEVRDPRIGFVTITQVEVSDDLKYAQVFYSVLGEEEKREETAKGLQQARGFLQRDLAKTLNLRFTPHLSFILDSSLEEGIKIDGIIRKIHEKE